MNNKNDDDEFVNIDDTEWYQEMKKERTPGKAMRVYRENKGYTQQELGEKMGGISRQNISHMERGVAAISKNNAKKLSKIFNMPVVRFI